MTIDPEQISKAKEILVSKGAKKGIIIGWIMILSVLVQAWDFFSASYILNYLDVLFHPSTLLLGIEAAGPFVGGAVGGLIGGYLVDKFGRRPLFLGDMIAMTVLAALQAVAPNMAWLTVIRIGLGVPLGIDIPIAFTYIMELVPAGRREILGNSYQLAYAGGLVLAGVGAIILTIAQVPANIFWRVQLSFGSVLAFIVLILRLNVPETPIWLLGDGHVKRAKAMAKSLYNIDLDMIPDEDFRPASANWKNLGEAFRIVKKYPKEWRAMLFGVFGNITFSIEFAGFAFFIPILLMLLKISSSLITSIITTAIYLLAILSVLIAMKITPKTGMRKLLIAGYSIVAIALIGGALSFNYKILLAIPILMAFYMFGHYWANEPSETILSLVSPTRYRGSVSGLGNFIILGVAAITIVTFTSLFDVLGVPLSLVFLLLISTVPGLLLSIFLLPEIYGKKIDAEY